MAAKRCCPVFRDRESPLDGVDERASPFAYDRHLLNAGFKKFLAESCCGWRIRRSNYRLRIGGRQRQHDLMPCKAKRAVGKPRQSLNLDVGTSVHLDYGKLARMPSHGESALLRRSASEHKRQHGERHCGNDEPSSQHEWAPRVSSNDLSGSD